ncbi:hypothetical protein [Moraxella oculi]|uniref:Uncharacterized protein n=1 Tax=Moraxella oculi TaxID=2940516 RepID=A0ABW8U4J4_9GAMM
MADDNIIQTEQANNRTDFEQQKEPDGDGNRGFEIALSQMPKIKLVSGVTLATFPKTLLLI